MVYPDRHTHLRRLRAASTPHHLARAADHEHTCVLLCTTRRHRHCQRVEFPVRKNRERYRFQPVGCETWSRRQDCTGEPHHRDRRDGEHEVHRLSTRPMRVLAQVARDAGLDGAGARYSGSRTHQAHAQGAVGSESASSRDIPGAARHHLRHELPLAIAPIVSRIAAGSRG